MDLMNDPREERLPEWAKTILLRLRNRCVRLDQERAALAQEPGRDPHAAQLVLGDSVPYRAVPLQGHTVRFTWPAPFGQKGAMRDVQVDVSVRERDARGATRLYVNGHTDALCVTPEAANAFGVRPVPWEW